VKVGAGASAWAATGFRVRLTIELEAKDLIALKDGIHLCVTVSFNDGISHECKFILGHVPGQDLEELGSGEVIGCDLVAIRRGSVTHG
jgi:hypothetical protein